MTLPHAPRHTPSNTLPHPTSQAPRTLKSEDLFDGAQLVVIVHQGETYRLQTTRQGKLILTK